MPQRGFSLLVKKAFDRTAAAIGLIATAPIFAGAAVAVRIKHGSPVLFSQTRPGLHGKPFKIYKLRTMTSERGPDGKLLPDEVRLTALGKLLRSTSLDELPQLWNVLKGELSLVGPRPLLMEYLPRYSKEQARRHDVLPGITGWAQIHGRNTVDWDKRFALDVWYVDNWSLLLDLKILAQTAMTVVRREGISKEGHATMTFFMGSESTHAPN